MEVIPVCAIMDILVTASAVVQVSQTLYYPTLIIKYSFTDIDECDLDTDMCHQQATCTDTEGSYSCTCNSGYSGNGLECNGKHTGSFMDIQ